MTTPRKVNLEQKFGLFAEHWSPKVVGELNGQQVKLAKLSGEFVWHAHEQEDELFFVMRGKLRLRFRDGEAVLGEGEFIVVPRGVEHQPVAETEEVWVVLFEPASTVNTGTAGGERTVTELEHL
ncbi:mannose-6-phosphate isomerase-like protein (cupin superfamily) [Deinococcus sp. HSC-46F16]|uniref:cupin domain-containing protein n=1 Tax=Deinococcus sp. HSC-46F16 TaxID=2910968 RepID=UPI00209F7ED6|nr:cupin domain-containing protein [Deinococcus sp. HSC-46F16]MCP2015160.1 mannose-6-phosphate isomerase-like protein (cupin superfamily) [Deinococcus sp. HSC-46F16]